MTNFTDEMIISKTYYKISNKLYDICCAIIKKLANEI